MPQYTEEQMNALIKKHMKLVYYVMRSRFNMIRSHPEWEDVAQVGCMGLLEGLKLHDPDKGAVSTICRTVIYHRIDGFFRQYKKQYNISQACYTAYKQNDIQTHKDETNAVDARVDIEKAMEVLTEQQRQVITMRFGLGNTKTMTGPKMGAKLGRSREWIRQMENRALEKLKRYFNRKTKVKKENK